MAAKLKISQWTTMKNIQDNCKQGEFDQRDCQHPQKIGSSRRRIFGKTVMNSIKKSKVLRS